MVKLEIIHKILKNIYYDIKNPASFSGIGKLYKAGKILFKKLTLKDVKTWLSEQKTYTLHKPIVRNFKRRKTIVAGIDIQWQADLADMQKFSKYNNGYRYLLCVIDVFSKMAWVKPIKNKLSTTLIKTFNNILNESHRIPKSLQTDKGSEFINKPFQKFLKNKHIHFFTTENPETKASVIERFLRTLKGKMWKYFTYNNTKKYIDVLQYLINNYNRSKHSSTGYKPTDANIGNEHIISNNINNNEISKDNKTIKIGDHVRINKTKKHFTKGYLPNWTLELFIVYKVINGSPITFKVHDLNGEEIKGSFYRNELQLIKNKGDYDIEKILKRRVII